MGDSFCLFLRFCLCSLLTQLAVVALSELPRRRTPLRPRPYPLPRRR